MKKEVWRNVKNYLGYQISSYGRVRSYRTTGRWNRTWPARKKNLHFLKGYIDKWGYRTVSLGAKNVRLVHHIVLEAFVGPRPEGCQCCHYDGNPSNNHLSNLRWATPKTNGEDRSRIGGYPLADNHHNAVLKAKVIPRMRKLHAQGMSYHALAAIYKVCPATIRSAVKRITWKSIE